MRNLCFGICFVLVFTTVLYTKAENAKVIEIIITSNLGGRLPLSENDAEDKLSKVADFIRKAREKNPELLYLDLGNAFFPGKLSRYSYGSVMADYFQMLKLDAGLVGEYDLNIGVESLDYIRKARGIRLLSMNIFREEENLFDPYILLKKSGYNITVLGHTPGGSFIDSSESELLGITRKSGTLLLPEVSERAKKENPDMVILLTGMRPERGLPLMRKVSGVDLFITNWPESKLSQMKLRDRRYIISVEPSAEILHLKVRKMSGRWEIISQESIEADSFSGKNGFMPSFERRLKTWQNAFSRERTLSDIYSFKNEIILNEDFVAGSLRSKYGCEISLLSPQDIADRSLSGEIPANEIAFSVENEYNVYLFRLPGIIIKKLPQFEKQYVFSGFTENKISGYEIKDKADYLICATQKAYEQIADQYKIRPKKENQFQGLFESLRYSLDLHETNPGESADRKFRLQTHFDLSNVYETGSIANPAALATPPGQPPASYVKWGLENNVQFIVYNRRHSFNFNPYIYYIRQNDTIVQNMLRNSLTYNYNTDYFIKPYQRNQVDTVIVPVNGLRPTLLRETLGAQILFLNITGRLGAGFEKDIHDPVRDPIWGLEGSLRMEYPVFSFLQYKMGLDTFFARSSADGLWRNRLELSNTFIFKISDPFTFSMGHRLYHLYQESLDNFYTASMFQISLDVRTIWKAP